MARCPVCSFRIRGKNHDEGKHHEQKNQSRLDRKAGVKAK